MARQNRSTRPSGPHPHGWRPRTSSYHQLSDLDREDFARCDRALENDDENSTNYALSTITPPAPIPTTASSVQAVETRLLAPEPAPTMENEVDTAESEGQSWMRSTACLWLWAILSLLLLFVVGFIAYMVMREIVKILPHIA